MSDVVKDELVRRLGLLNDEVLHKLDGLGAYDLRRPLTPTGTNLGGVVKHLATVQAGYLGDVFGRPWPEATPWMGPEAELNADLFLSAEQSADWVRDFYRRSWTHAVETLAVTELATTGTVPWWPEEHRHPTLGRILIHLLVETARHAGHLDIVRELIDGTVGQKPDDPNIAGPDDFDWTGYVERLETLARQVGQPPT